MSLKEKAMAMNSGKGIEFMEGRTKGDTEELLQVKYATIRDYDFIENEEGEYVVFIIDQVADKFFFGGSVLTNNLKSLTPEEKTELQNDGLPTKFETRKSKKKRDYMAVEFYPEA